MSTPTHDNSASSASSSVKVRVAAVGVHVLDVHVIGVDTIPAGSDGQLVETIRLSPAGTAGGTAVVLSRLGVEVSSFGAVGDDVIAEVLPPLLAREGIDTSGLVRTQAAQSSASVIPVRPNGDRPAWHCIGANGAFSTADLDLERIMRFDHLHLGGPEFLGGPAAGELLAAARAAGLTTSIDVLAPGDPDMLAWIADALPHTDYLLPNDEQVLGFTGETDLASGARALVDAGAKCVAVTAGKDGALIVTADEVIAVPAFAIEAIDTTGCGDAFSAGFITGVRHGLGLREAGRLGCAAAAQVAQGLGTDAGTYDYDSVRAFAASTATR